MKIVVALLLCGFATQAFSENAPEVAGPAQHVEKTFGDWSKICVAETTGGEVCQIVQSANQNDSGRLVFQTAVGYVPDNDKPIMYLTAPLGIYLPRGISIFVDKNPGLTATVQRCDGGGCLALLSLDDKFLSLLESGDQGKLVFAASASKNVSLPLSLNGFKAAFDSLDRPAVPAKVK